MNEPVTLQQVLITGIGVLIAALAPQLYNIYVRYKDSKDKERQLESEEEARKLADDARRDEQKLSEQDKMFQQFDNLIKGYIRQIESLRHLEEENAALRPLVLKNALIQQENKQLKEDKEDWKTHAIRLSDQIEAMGQVPIPFRRTPRDGATQEKIKAIRTKMEAVEEDIKLNTPTETILENVARTVDNREMPATTDTPTIIPKG